MYSTVHVELIVQLFARASPALFETSALRRHFDPRVAIATDAVMEQLAQVSDSAAAGTQQRSHPMARPFPPLASEPPAVGSGARVATNSDAIVSIHLLAFLSALDSHSYR